MLLQTYLMDTSNPGEWQFYSQSFDNGAGVIADMVCLNLKANSDDDIEVRGVAVEVCYVPGKYLYLFTQLVWMILNLGFRLVWSNTHDRLIINLVLNNLHVCNRQNI